MTKYFEVLVYDLEHTIVMCVKCLDQCILTVLDSMMFLLKVHRDVVVFLLALCCMKLANPISGYLNKE